MKRKYYVKWGQEEVMVSAFNSLQAAVVGMKKILIREKQDYDKDCALKVSQNIIVSERGFEMPHTDDVVYSSIDVLKVVKLSSDKMVTKQLKNPTLRPEDVDKLFEEGEMDELY